MPEALASGVLSWTGKERRSDRYGAIFVDDSTAGDSSPVDVTPVVHRNTIQSLEGTVGTLTAIVETGRESSHIGDIFHGLVQTEVPTEGERFVLGEGEFFVERGDFATGDEYMDSIGVKPVESDDGGWWLNPEPLYQLHDCTVTLAFEPASASASEGSTQKQLR